MASVVFYFQVHQPYRLRRYSVFDADPFYFDSQKNGEICKKVAEKCYRPATNLILDLVKRHQGRFKVAYALTGVVIDQWQEFCPDVLDIFRRLNDTGCVEFVGETYYHSLSFLYSRDEFKAQIAHQGDRYWAEWVVVELRADKLVCLHRFMSVADAALQLKRLLESQKVQLKPAAFKAVAQRIKVVRDSEGQFGATGTVRVLEGLPQPLLSQMEGLHYAVKQQQVVIRIPYLDAATAEQVNQAIAAAMIAMAREARQIQAEVG
jgi:hypothetical protein